MDSVSNWFLDMMDWTLKVMFILAVVFTISHFGFRVGQFSVTKDACKHLFEKHADVDKCMDNPPWEKE